MLLLHVAERNDYYIRLLHRDVKMDQVQKDSYDFQIHQI